MKHPLCAALIALAPGVAPAVEIVFTNGVNDMPGPGYCSPCSVTPAPDYQIWDRMDLPAAVRVHSVQFAIDDLTPGGAAYIRLGVSREMGGRYLYTRVFQRSEWQNYDPPYPTTNRGILIPMPSQITLGAGTWYFTIYGERGTRFGLRPSVVAHDRSQQAWSFAEQRWYSTSEDAGVAVYGEYVQGACAQGQTTAPAVNNGAHSALLCN